MKIAATLADMLAQRDVSYGDWPSTFGYATGFDLDDVAEVIASDVVYGDYAETDCVALLRLKSGKYATVSASCDTTGWDCRAGGSGSIFDTLADAIRLGLSPEEQTRLEISP